MKNLLQTGIKSRICFPKSYLILLVFLSNGVVWSQTTTFDGVVIVNKPGSSPDSSSISLTSPGGGVGITLREGASTLRGDLYMKNSILRLRANAGINTADNSGFNINSSNNVGLGTDAPTVKLDVNGAIRAGGYNVGPANINAFSYEVGGASPTATNGQATIFLHHFNAVSHQLRYASGTLFLEAAGNGYGTNGIPNFVVGGNVGIGTTAPAFKLDVSGQVRSTGGYVTSDSRFKKDLKRLDNSTQKLFSLSGITYNYKADEFKNWNFSKEKQIGFLAQEVQKAFPELVSKDSNGYLSVNYIGLIPVIVEALKEQQKTIEAKDDQVKALEERIASMEKAMGIQSKNAFSSGDATRSRLYQNNPNPASQLTSITYEIPASTGQATLFIHDIQGKPLKQVNLTTKGKGSVNIQAKELGSGIYIYSLVVDGVIIETHKMILTD